MSDKFVLIIEFIVALLVTFFLTPIIQKFSKKGGFIGEDKYKIRKVKVAEMGGLAILGGYALSLLTTLYFVNQNLKFQLLAALSSILLIGILGIADDMFELQQREKIWLPLFAAVPLIFARSGITTVRLPFLGFVDLGLIYTLLLIPIGVMVASNLTNMLAGFNGLESGLGLISSIAIAICAVILNRYYALLIILPLIGALIAFLYFNWHPAKIFPGDIGTLMVGGVIAVAVIVGNMELIGVYVMSLYIINFLMYILNLKKFLKNGWKFGKVDKNCCIHPPDKKARFGSVYYLLSYYFRLKEKGLVKTILSIHAIICGIIILWVLFIGGIL
jgi:UDP-N-acetylglucosamine--dolichyl-phosphate N-acetylglucosaminephosphotransferase